MTSGSGRLSRKRLESRLRGALAYFVLSVASLIAILPVYWMIATSLKSRWDAFRIPPMWLFKPTFSNFEAVLFARGGWSYTPLYILLQHSLIISLLATILVLAFSSAAAYSLARFRTRGGREIATWMLTTRVFPPAVVAIPIFLMMNRLHLVDTYTGLALVYAAINLPFAVWMLVGFFKQVPVELEEAIMVDGGTRIQAFFYVTIPLAAAGLAATAAFVWIQCWNEFLFALLLTRSLKTAPVSVTEFVTLYGIQWGQLTAEATAMALPPLIIMIFLQRYFVRGLALGAVKN